jgi:hypothetical protein
MELGEWGQGLLSAISLLSGVIFLCRTTGLPVRRSTYCEPKKKGACGACPRQIESDRKVAAYSVAGGGVGVGGSSGPVRPLTWRPRNGWSPNSVSFSERVP